jgi:hypothetical protein
MNHELRVLEANIASAEGRIGVLLSSMDAWSMKKLGMAEIKRRDRQIENLRVNIREWRRLAESIKRMEMN